MPRKSPKHLFGFALVAASLALLMSGALAQTPAASPQASSTGPQIGDNDRREMDNYLIRRPDVAEELHKDPSLINNPSWLASHPEVQHFMSTHPNVQRMAAEHPDFATKQIEHSAESKVDRGAARTDQFLQNHPKVAQELANNPRLIDNKQYLAQHPQLNNYLNDHPEIKSDWQAHPRAFSKVAEAYHQDQLKREKPSTEHSTTGNLPSTTNHSTTAVRSTAMNHPVKK